MTAIRCWLNRPRWSHVEWAWGSTDVCAHCGAERDSRRHPRGRR